MHKQKMTYPPSLETRRQRDQRVALSRRALNDGPVNAERLEPCARVSPRGLTMTWGAFQGGDFGQLCQFLGLSPSRPRQAHKTSA